MAALNRLTAKFINGAKSGEKIRKLSDGGRLYCCIMPTGARLWRQAYTFNGEERSFSIGEYPAVSIAEARKARDEVRRLVRDGRDPVEERRAQRAGRVVDAKSTFGAVAQDFLDKKKAENKAPRTLEKMEWLLRLVASDLNRRPIREITPPVILAALRPVEARGRYASAHALRGVVGQVFRYAVACGVCGSDPTRDLRAALVEPSPRKMPAIVEPSAFGGLLRAISGFQGSPETRIALQLLALLAVRPGELRGAEWVEFDLDGADPVWTIPLARMKMKRAKGKDRAPHRVPLASAAIALLRELRAMSGHRRLLFPSVTNADRPVSENVWSAALHRMGIEDHCPHGFRASFRTISNESGLWPNDVVEISACARVGRPHRERLRPGHEMAPARRAYGLVGSPMRLAARRDVPGRAGALDRSPRRRQHLIAANGDADGNAPAFPRPRSETKRLEKGELAWLPRPKRLRRPSRWRNDSPTGTSASKKSRSSGNCRVRRSAPRSSAVI